MVGSCVVCGRVSAHISATFHFPLFPHFLYLQVCAVTGVPNPRSTSTPTTCLRISVANTECYYSEYSCNSLIRKSNSNQIFSDILARQEQMRHARKQQHTHSSFSALPHVPDAYVSMARLSGTLACTLSVFAVFFACACAQQSRLTVLCEWTGPPSGCVCGYCVHAQLFSGGGWFSMLSCVDIARCLLFSLSLLPLISSQRSLP